MEEKQERNWVVFCHLGGLIPVYLLDIAIPLLIWLTKRKDSSFIDEQGKEIVNFQISLTIYGIALTLFAFTIIGIVIALPGWIILMFISFISIIRGAIKASEGEKFLYPINLRLIK